MDNQIVCQLAAAFVLSVDPDEADELDDPDDSEEPDDPDAPFEEEEPTDVDSLDLPAPARLALPVRLSVR